MVETRSDQKITYRRFVVPFNFSEAAKKMSRSKATEIINKLDAGEQFIAIIKEHSDDRKTRDKGGDLGVKIMTELEPEIRQVVEPLEIGKYSTPLETKTGLYIYKIEDRKTPELSQQEKQQIIGILRQQMFEKEWTAYTDSLLENAYVKIKPDAVAEPNTKDN